MGWMDKLQKNVTRAASFVANPMELHDLDALVDHFMFQYDNNIWTSSFEDGPPTEEQCKAKESEWEGQFNSEYNVEAVKTAGRKEVNNQDNIAVRRRIMNRQFVSRRGKLYGRISEQVNNLKSQASAAISLASESFQDTKAAVEASFPCTEANIIEEFAQSKRSVTSQVNSSFPGGEEALGQYDDDLDDGVPSLEELRADIEMEQAHLIAANEEHCAEAILDVKQAIRAQTIEQLTAALDDIRSQLEVSVPFLDAAASATLLQEGQDELDNFVHSSINKIMDGWAGFDAEKEEGDEPASEAVEES